MMGVALQHDLDVLHRLLANGPGTAGPVGSHSELAQELAEPLLDLDALLSAFVPAGSLSSSEVVAVVNPGVVEARHPAVSSVNGDSKIQLRNNNPTRGTEAGDQAGQIWEFRGKQMTDFLSNFPRTAPPTPSTTCRRCPLIGGSERRLFLLVKKRCTGRRVTRREEEFKQEWREIDNERGGATDQHALKEMNNLHKNLEQKLAEFHEREDCILYASCFDANAGLFEVLLGPDDAVLSDELNHASIIDGIRLCRAKRLRYKHMDLSDLEVKLKEAQSSRMRLVVTDGVFSMDGDVAPLRGICDLAERYGAMVFIDECHATGFLGPRGRGTDELLGVMDRVQIVNSTLGKALGGAAGGYTVGPKPLIDLLRQRSRPYLFSNALPPPVVGCATRAVELLLASNEIAQSMTAKTMRFRNKMTQAGFTIAGSSHPICPVMLGDARLASLMADDMLQHGERKRPGRNPRRVGPDAEPRLTTRLLPPPPPPTGIYVIGFSYPVVPKGKARIRVQISAAHTDDDIDHCVNAFIQTGRKHGVVS
ncbi:hypothetical protein CCH79_00014729 [Gambusia affinis]|uniref:Aminotransferase class I/classII large domain-containing protein n=1 Tax=Gambusia affinis TaxID=33528 RepID=A0A315UVN9_GAMAF|nr:hypothetical protein CCH79_00014729 [Gambusia affinis]